MTRRRDISAPQLRRMWFLARRKHGDMADQILHDAAEGWFGKRSLGLKHGAKGHPLTHTQAAAIIQWLETDVIPSWVLDGGPSPAQLNYINNLADRAGMDDADLRRLARVCRCDWPPKTMAAARMLAAAIKGG